MFKTKPERWDTLTPRKANRKKGRTEARTECTFGEEAEHAAETEEGLRKKPGSPRGLMWLGVTSQGDCGGTGSKAKHSRRLRLKNTPVGWVAAKLLVTFMRAGVLESWKQMTDGNVWRREREAKGGGGEPRHEKDRASCGWKGEPNQGKFIFRTRQKEPTASVGREQGA